MGALYITILPLVPFIEEISVSAAVTVHVPAALNVTLNTFSPLSEVLNVYVEGDITALASVDVMFTVPV